MVAVGLGGSSVAFVQCCSWRLVAAAGGVKSVFAAFEICFWELLDLVWYPIAAVAFVALLMRCLWCYCVAFSVFCYCALAY